MKLSNNYFHSFQKIIILNLQLSILSKATEWISLIKRFKFCWSRNRSQLNTYLIYWLSRLFTKIFPRDNCKLLVLCKSTKAFLIFYLCKSIKKSSNKVKIAAFNLSKALRPFFYISVPFYTIVKQPNFALMFLIIFIHLSFCFVKVSARCFGMRQKNLIGKVS